MEAIKQILSFFAHILVFYIDLLKSILGVVFSGDWLDLVTIYTSLYIPVILLFSLLVRRPVRELLTNLTVHIYVLVMSIIVTLLAGEGLVFTKSNGELTKNIFLTGFIWFLTVFNMLKLFNRVFIIETAGSRVVDYSERKRRNNSVNQNNNKTFKRKRKENFNNLKNQKFLKEE